MTILGVRGDCRGPFSPSSLGGGPGPHPVRGVKIMDLGVQIMDLGSQNRVLGGPGDCRGPFSPSSLGGGPGGDPEKGHFHRF